MTEVFADPSPEVGLPLIEFVEIFNPGKDAVDLEGWVFSDPDTKATIRKAAIFSNEYAILCPVADTLQYKPFGKVIGISPWPSLNNSSDQIALKNSKGSLVDSLAYSDTWYRNSLKKSGGWSLERIDIFSLCKGLYNWTASNDITGGTPGRKNSVYQIDYDKKSLTADSIKQLSDSTVLVSFSKSVDVGSASTDKFRLSPDAGKLSSISFDPDYRQATLTFRPKLIPAVKYELIINAISDCSGNLFSSTKSLTFQSSAITGPLPGTARTDTARLYITELLADPSPEIGLPLVEFVEVYNPGKDAVDLEGWTLNDPGTKGTLKKSSILPNEHIILCPASDTLQYKSFGRAIGVSPWPSLNNSGDQISLKSFKGRLVDSVSYSDSWYKNNLKKAGGWTLEKSAYESENNFYTWDASTNVKGGSPGTLNSIYKAGANRALGVDSITIASDSTLRVYLNTIPDTSFIKSSYFNITPKIAVSNIILGSGYKDLTIALKGHLEEQKEYAISVDSLQNYKGLKINPFEKVILIKGIPEQQYPVIITEIFPDPSPQVGLPESEFIELHNTSDTPVDLKGMSYEDDSGSKYVFKKGLIEAKGYLILCADKDTAVYKAFGKTLGISPWPSLNNDKDVLILKNNRGKEINRVSYNSSWYKNKDKTAGGWSLEMIDPQTICSGFQNWMASMAQAGGTPGKQNSAHKLFNTNEPLKLVNALLIDSVTVELDFNRPVDSLSATDPQRFSVNNGAGGPVSLTPLGPEFERIRLSFPKGITRGKNYKVTVRDLVDCSGAGISSEFNSSEFFFPERIAKNDILINEVLFNPRPGGVDFVEIYNKSQNTLDLKDLFLATLSEKDSVISKKQLSTKQLLVQPRQYIVFTTDPDNIKKEYKVEQSAVLLKMSSFPAFNDDAGKVLLVSGEARIDQFNYSEKMHFKLIKNPEGVSLERSSFTKPANEPGNFRSAAASAGYATPGAKNSQYAEDQPSSQEEVAFTSKTFSPDNDGFEDILTLNYHFDKPGFIANAAVYDNKGVLIRKIAKNQTLAAEGVFIWDGLTETGTKPPVGVYMVYLEVFSLDGTVRRYRKNCVLATKLN